MKSRVLLLGFVLGWCMLLPAGLFGIDEITEEEAASLANPNITKANEFSQLGASQGTETEIRSTEEFLEFTRLDPIPDKLIEWDANSGKFLYLSKFELPYVYFMGKLADGLELMFNDRWVRTRDGAFSIKVPLKLKPAVLTFKIFKTNGEVVTFRLINYWLKLPSTISYRVQVDGKVVEIGKSFYTQFQHSAFLQLYSGDQPTSVIDLDTQQYAKLSFRVYAPPKPEEVYDAWEVIIRNERGAVVGKIRRYGFPPPFIDWREVGLSVFEAGSFTYQIDLIAGSKRYAGATNEFRTVEGLTLLAHDYMPLVSMEPRGELGFFSFSNGGGLSYDNQFVGGDLSFVFWNRWILRGYGMASIHAVDPTNSIAFGRLGVGVRFFGHGRSALWGRPHIYRLDILANYTMFTVSPTSQFRRFTAFSGLIEPHLVLWKYHYLSPHFEWATSASFDIQRISLGLTYHFHIRPWSVKMGLGFAYDNLYHYAPSPAAQFQLMRMHASFTFFL